MCLPEEAPEMYGVVTAGFEVDLFYKIIPLPLTTGPSLAKVLNFS